MNEPESEAETSRGSQEQDAAGFHGGMPRLDAAASADLSIDILGKSFIITAGEDPEFLEDVLSQYQSDVADMSLIPGTKDDPLKVAILCGFMLRAEINKMKMQTEENAARAQVRQAGDEQELERITRNMIACIDQVLERTDFND